MTALDIIKSALRSIGVLAEDESPSAGMSTDAMNLLKMMIDEWYNENLMLYKSASVLFTTKAQASMTIGEGFTLSAHAGAWTVGNYVKGSDNGFGRLLRKVGNDFYIEKIGGTFAVSNSITEYSDRYFQNTVSGSTGTISVIPEIHAKCPIKVDNLYVNVNDIDYQIALIESSEYDEITQKDFASTFSTHAAYERNFPNGTLYFYPVPDAGDTATLNYKRQFDEIVKLTDELVLPPGYEMALRYNLAIEIAPEYGKTVSPLFYQRAEKAKDTLKRSNLETIMSKIDCALLPGAREVPNRIFEG